MARFRLRFLLQEFDLVGPEVILGRSPECHITLEDPLVSRHHARIRIDGDEAAISDLGSRNGVRINGRLIDAECGIIDGDRIRLGTQELVFAIVRASAREARPTGFMRVCSSCGTPYPEIAPECPHCGANEPRDEDTISGLMVEPKRSWTFQLLGEVIERAIGTGRGPEAERLMRRAAREIDERLAAGDRLDPSQVALITAYALQLAKLSGAVSWVMWAMGVHRAQSLMPSGTVIDRLEDLDVEALPEFPAVIEGFVTWWRDQGQRAPSTDLAGLARLEKLTR